MRQLETIQLETKYLEGKSCHYIEGIIQAGMYKTFIRLSSRQIFAFIPAATLQYTDLLADKTAALAWFIVNHIYC